MLFISPQKLLFILKIFKFLFWLFGHVVKQLDKKDKVKNLNWAYLGVNGLKFSTVCFYCMPSWGLSKYTETKLQTICFCLILGFFKKKKGVELVSLPHFLHNFWRKIFLWLYSINWPSFIAWLPLLCEILANIFIAIVC